MPASEAGTPADFPDSIAPVVSLQAFRRLMTRPPADAPPGDERAAQFWKSVFAEYNLSLTGAAPVEDVLRIVAERMEAMVTGLLYLREGGGPRNLAPDDAAGVDYTGATEVVGLLREMGAAPAMVRGMASKR
jgi:hypothetical protein